MTKNLIVIMAHSDQTAPPGVLKAQEVFAQHQPLWEAMGQDILVASPEDKPLQSKYENLIWGKASHSGMKSYDRAKNLFLSLLGRRYEYYLLFEYDAFCLDPNPTLQPGLYGTLEPNMEPHRFQADPYAVNPYSIDRATLKQLWQSILDHPTIMEAGLFDRLLTSWALASGITPKDWQGGFARNTILESERAELTDALNAGATWIHGVKTREIFDLCCQFKKGHA